MWRKLRIIQGSGTRDIAEEFGPGQTISRDWLSIAPAKVPVPPLIDVAEQNWASARVSSDPNEIQAFLTKYPNGPHEAEAQSRLDNLIWSRVNQSDAPALRDYVSRFARGTHASDALLHLADLAWNSIDQKNEQAVRSFIRQNSDNPHRAQAQTILDQFEKQRLDAAERLRQDRAKEESKKQVDAELVRQTADRPKILHTLVQYEEAYRAKDIAQLTVVYPSLPAAMVKSIADAFRRADSFQMDLKPLGEPQISGDSAVVRVERSIHQIQRGRALDPVQGPVTVRMRRSGQAWVIESIQ